MIKKWILFLLISNLCSAQDFSEVDRRIAQYERYTKVEDLANQINNDFSEDLDQVRAVFTWLAKNIRYDLAEFYNPRQRAYQFRYSTEVEKERKLQALKDKLVAQAFLTKKGVCEEYAQSFKKVCDLLGIEAEVITGYVRNSASEINRIPNRTNHAWNAVKIDDKWMMLDATWAAGYEMNGQWKRAFNDYYFDIPKTHFFKTHFPEQSIWVLRFGRMTLRDFYNQPLYGTAFFNNNLELVSPKNGIIRTQDEELIHITIKNLNDSVFYTFSGSRVVRKANIVKRGEQSFISLPNPRRNTSLLLFLNRQELLQFQLQN